MILTTYSFSEVKQLIYCITVLLFTFAMWILSVILVSSISWRVWEFDSQVVPLAYIGLWKAQYYLRENTSVLVLAEADIHSGWTYAVELEYAKELMMLVNFMLFAAVIFCTVAFIVSRSKTNYQDFLTLYYTFSALLLLLSSGCVALAVSWNYTMDLSGQSTLDFPLEFPVEKEDVTKKHSSYVFPLGISTAALSFLDAILCLYSMIFTEPKPMPPEDDP
ncbi:uncharacterized protein LOC101562067 [Octodon degus]|uniref:Uncharacterized protein LOC101562067 n=1 Tax=Octodon degus TaxID=10160 RepID=A0A6P6DXJ8_OCTDE|nr:uncharacterized protein LOC101562067 [Octodon degus]